MLAYIIPILIFVLLGALSGVILVFASRVLYTPADETVEKIVAELPGLNCGACGFSGCEGYAAAIAGGSVAPNLCKPGGVKTAEGIGAALGLSVAAPVREVAYVHCLSCGDKKITKFDYNGVPACYAVSRLYGGSGGCAYGCTGYGDCAKVCEYGAISTLSGVAVIDSSLCNSCGKCIGACPRGLITFRKVNAVTQVTCKSDDDGKKTRTVCQNGCIACKVCVKKCPTGAITIADGQRHAEINPDECTNCGACAAACPRHCIVQLPVCD